MPGIVIGIIAALVGVALGFGIGYFIRKSLAEAKISSAEEAAKRIVEDAPRKRKH